MRLHDLFTGEASVSEKAYSYVSGMTTCKLWQWLNKSIFQTFYQPRQQQLPISLVVSLSEVRPLSSISNRRSAIQGLLFITGGCGFVRNPYSSSTKPCISQCGHLAHVSLTYLRYYIFWIFSSLARVDLPVSPSLQHEDFATQTWCSCHLPCGAALSSSYQA